MPTAPSPLLNACELVSFRLTVSGRTLDGSHQVTAIRVMHAANQTPVACINLFVGDPGAESANFPAANSPAFETGNAVGIFLGYGTAERAVFSGRITRVGIRQSAGTSAKLVVECQGATAKAVAADLARPPSLTLTYGADLVQFDLADETPKGAPTRKLSGSLEFQGSSLVHPGDTVILAGLGARFDGTVTVGSVVQLVSDGLWRTTVSLWGAGPIRGNARGRTTKRTRLTPP